MERIPCYREHGGCWLSAAAQMRVHGALVDKEMHFGAEQRRSQGWLSFQDLLEKAVLLRDHPPAGERGGVCGAIDLVFRVAGRWKIADYQREPDLEREANARVWRQELAGEPVVEKGVWHIETGVWHKL